MLECFDFLNNNRKCIPKEISYIALHLLSYKSTCLFRYNQWETKIVRLFYSTFKKIHQNYTVVDKTEWIFPCFIIMSIHLLI